MSSQTVAPPGTLAELQSYPPEQIQSVGAYRYLPTPPDEGDLHDGAVSGDRPSYGVGMMREAVEQELYRRIESGEIPVSDLLSMEQDPGGE